jgi:hypothetical protein
MTKVPEYLKRGSAAGRSQKLSDTAFWLPDLPDEYITLLDKLDHTRDPRLLLPYLKVPEAVRPHFADLFERLAFKSRSRKLPSYQRTDKQKRLLMAVEAVRRERRRGVFRADAIAKAQRNYGVAADTIGAALSGKHYSFRKATARA